MTFNIPKLVSVIVDNDSWILPFAETLVLEFCRQGHKAILCKNVNEVCKGHVAFFLGCEKITPLNVLEKNKYNLVVHESDLPKGRGFAPVAWQVIEGKNEIVMCLIEALKNVDQGEIFLRRKMYLSGAELNNEIRELQGRLTLELCHEFLDMEEPPIGEPQIGTADYLCRRTPKDSELDVNKTIFEQFNLLRTVDNDRYPAYFILNGIKYTLLINQDELL